ncbi:M23 family metallopeptidase [Aestuariimicrobium ganziense]|uniref:M23 family metallopeptidase n=1 Tax=Aestuariimicrobium ganziense TaxID=2773677 RepID=UPI0019429D08|nr:M23 family metallopeptidase [Aestuariimicrobium ganziense]
MPIRVNLRAPRPRVNDLADDFSDIDDSTDQQGRLGGLVRPVVASLVVGMLGVGVAVGVFTASASNSDEQDLSSVVVDENTPDQSKAAPIDENLTAEQVAAKKSDEQSRETSAGGLQGFGQRGTTVNRSSVRSALDASITNGTTSTRNTRLKADSSKVTLTQAQAEAKEREELMAADVAKVKKEAKRIEEEKRKAEELLKKQRELAKKAGDAPGPNSGVNLGDLSAVISQGGGGALPVPLGRATIGAHWGQVGSWSRYHTGQDFPAATGTPIYAAASGVVSSNTSAGGWAGTYVVLHHANGGSTLYAHMSAKNVRPGQVVKAGDVIGFVGNTGRSFGSHLHFEYYPPGTTPGDVYAASDPMAFLRSLGVRI